VTLATFGSLDFAMFVSRRCGWSGFKD